MLVLGVKEIFKSYLVYRMWGCAMFITHRDRRYVGMFLYFVSYGTSGEFEKDEFSKNFFRGFISILRMLL